MSIGNTHKFTSMSLEILRDSDITRLSVHEPAHCGHGHACKQHDRSVVHVVLGHWVVSGKAHEDRNVDAPNQGNSCDWSMETAQGIGSAGDIAVLEAPNGIEQQRECVGEDERNCASRGDAVVCGSVADVNQADGGNDGPGQNESRSRGFGTFTNMSKARRKTSISGKCPHNA